MKLSAYDKARLRKWADGLAIEHINRGDNINPFLKAANWMIRDSYRLSLDIGGGITPKQIERFFESEYMKK